MKNEAKALKMQVASFLATFFGIGLLTGLLVLRDGNPWDVTSAMLVLLVVGLMAAIVMFCIVFFKEECIELRHEQIWRFCMVVYISTVTAVIILPFAKLSIKAGVTLIAVGLATATWLILLLFGGFMSART